MNEFLTTRAPRPSRVVPTLSELAQLRRSFVEQEQALRTRDLFVMIWSVIFAVGGMIYAASGPLGLGRLLSRELVLVVVMLVAATAILLFAALVQHYRVSRERAADFVRRFELQTELEGILRDKMR